MFGVDFNPAADRLRIISDTGQNLAHNVNAGGVTAANGTLTYTRAARHCGAGARRHGGRLHEQRSESAEHGHDAVRPGHDARSGRHPVASRATASSSRPGSSALMPRPAAGFDIYSQLANGVTVANFPFATLSVNGKYRFYAINAHDGPGVLGWASFDHAVVDIAIRLDQ